MVVDGYEGKKVRRVVMVSGGGGGIRGSLPAWYLQVKKAKGKSKTKNDN